MVALACFPTVTRAVPLTYAVMVVVLADDRELAELLAYPSLVCFHLHVDIIPYDVLGSKHTNR